MLLRKSMDKSLMEAEGEVKGVSRRNFLGYLGGASALLITAASCKKDDNNTNNTGVNLGSGDTGVLNYAYALEQLEAAFYTQVIMTPYIGISEMPV